MGKFTNFFIGLVMFLLSNYCAVAKALEQEQDDLDSKYIEKRLTSNLNLEIANKVEFLQKEVQELRGIVEEQQHFLEKISNLCDHKNINIVENGFPNVGANILATDQIKYNQAYKLIEEKKFSEAMVVFKDFVEQYKNSKYTPNSIYWLGELYLHKQDLAIAEDYFLQLINKYQDHNKVPEALLKLGVVEFERKNFSKAQEYFSKVVKNYPYSNSAQVAKSSLDNLSTK